MIDLCRAMEHADVDLVHDHRRGNYPGRVHCHRRHSGHLPEQELTKATVRFYRLIVAFSAACLLPYCMLL